LLVTHEHGDHNAVEVIGGSPQILRSTAGTFGSPVGEVKSVASEHDDAAGTRRGPNTIFCFGLDGLRVCHFGDFGQAELRAEQKRAIGVVDVLFLPVGGGPTVGGEPAAAIVRALRPRLVATGLRPRVVASTMRTASQRARCSISRSTSRAASGTPGTSGPPAAGGCSRDAHGFPARDATRRASSSV
jgi:hypothetical protein